MEGSGGVEVVELVGGGGEGVEGIFVAGGGGGRAVRICQITPGTKGRREQTYRPDNFLTMFLKLRIMP